MTYFSGWVDEFDLAYLGGTPNGLIDVLGVRGTELDAIYPHDQNALVLNDGRRFAIRELCEIPENHGAETLGVFESDFYAGMPCLSKNRYGEGTAYYLSAKLEQDGLDAIYGDIAAELALTRALPDELPAGVIPTERGGAVFLQNYSGQEQIFTLAESYTDLLTGETVHQIILPANGVMVLKK